MNRSAKVPLSLPLLFAFSLTSLLFISRAVSAESVSLKDWQPGAPCSVIESVRGSGSCTGTEISVVPWFPATGAKDLLSSTGSTLIADDDPSGVYPEAWVSHKIQVPACSSSPFNLTASIDNLTESTDWGKGFALIDSASGQLLGVSSGSSVGEETFSFSGLTKAQATSGSVYLVFGVDFSGDASSETYANLNAQLSFDNSGCNTSNSTPNSTPTAPKTGLIGATVAIIAVAGLSFIIYLSVFKPNKKSHRLK